MLRFQSNDGSKFEQVSINGFSATHMVRNAKGEKINRWGPYENPKDIEQDFKNWQNLMSRRKDWSEVPGNAAWDIKTLPKSLLDSLKKIKARRIKVSSKIIIRLYDNPEECLLATHLYDFWESENGPRCPQWIVIGDVDQWDLICDTRDGWIGLRNHNFPYGLTFISPDIKTLEKVLDQIQKMSQSKVFEGDTPEEKKIQKLRKTLSVAYKGRKTSEFDAQSALRLAYKPNCWRHMELPGHETRWYMTTDKPKRGFTYLKKGEDYCAIGSDKLNVIMIKYREGESGPAIISTHTTRTELNKAKTALQDEALADGYKPLSDTGSTSNSKSEKKASKKKAASSKSVKIGRITLAAPDAAFIQALADQLKQPTDEILKWMKEENSVYEKSVVKAGQFKIIALNEKFKLKNMPSISELKGLKEIHLAGASMKSFKAEPPLKRASFKETAIEKIKLNGSELIEFKCEKDKKLTSLDLGKFQPSTCEFYLDVCPKLNQITCQEHLVIHPTDDLSPKVTYKLSRSDPKQLFEWVIRTDVLDLDRSRAGIDWYLKHPNRSLAGIKTLYFMLSPENSYQNPEKYEKDKGIDGVMYRLAIDLESQVLSGKVKSHGIAWKPHKLAYYKKELKKCQRPLPEIMLEAVKGE